MDINLKDLNIDLSALNNLSQEERELALSILQEYASEGESNKLKELILEDYAEVPVDIETFVDDYEYLGNAWHDSEGKTKLYPYWRKELKKLFPDNLTTTVNNAIFSGSRGRGKAQPLDSLVFTENGYKEMGSLTLQDKVYGRDGKLHNILGIYPQGKKPVVEITFSDYTKTECSDEHLWTILDTKDNKVKTLTAKQIYSNGIYKRKLANGWTEKRYSLPKLDPLEFKENKHLISPYMLGCLLGDGCFSETVGFTTNDSEIYNLLNNELLENNYEFKKHSKDKNDISYYIVNKNHKSSLDKNIYWEEIKRLNLEKKNSKEKFIPKEYLYDSVNNRLELLQGLLDTDGECRKDGQISFATTSKQLIKDIIWLIQSLGGLATNYKEIKNNTYTYVNKKTLEKEIRSCADVYSIGVKIPKKLKPFKLTRKLNRLNENRIEPKRRIIDIKYIEDKECQCIYIDSEEHLYLTNDLIPTHNTEVATLIAAYLLHRLLCLKDPVAYFHLKPTEKIVFAFMNIKKALAEEIGIAKFQNTLQSSPWFMSHGYLEGRTKPVWVPKKFNDQVAIDIKIGSQADDLIGLPVYFCLEGNTKILTNEGIFKIKDLVDKKIKVFNINENNECELSDECTVKVTAKSKEAYKIELEDGSIIECTPNHRFMLKDGSYKEAKDLTENDDILEYKPIGYIYKVTNKLTGEFYIGQHKKSTFDKNYYGSGVKIKNSYNKYGKNNFKLEILDWAKTVTELNEKEELYIKESFADSKNINLSKTAISGNNNPTDWRLRNHLYTNGSEVKYFEDANIPEGYHITTSNKNKTAITNGQITKYIDLNTKKIPEGFYKGNSNTAGKHDMTNYYNNMEMQKKNSLSKSGEKNSMYGKGYKVSCEKNGHFGKPAYELATKKAKEANTKYIYHLDGKDFFGINELQRYLKSLNIKISDTGIEGLVKHNKKISKIYPNLIITKEKIHHED